MQKAFTIMELIFVIVVLGILSAVALPRLAGTVNKAYITKGENTLAVVRSAIATERQKRILRGDFTDITSLGAGFSAFSADARGVTASILDTPVSSGCQDPGCWEGTTDEYTFHYEGGTCTFRLLGNKLTGGCGVFGN